MNENPNERIVPFDALRYFKLHPVPSGCFLSNEDHRCARAFQAIQNHVLNSPTTNRLSFFPLRSVDEPHRGRTKEQATVSDLVHAPNVAFVVKSEVGVTLGSGLLASLLGGGFYPFSKFPGIPIVNRCSR